MKYHSVIAAIAMLFIIKISDSSSDATIRRSVARAGSGIIVKSTTLAAIRL